MMETPRKMLVKKQSHNILMIDKTLIPPITKMSERQLIYSLNKLQ